MDMIDGDGRMCGSAWRWVLGWGAALLTVAGMGAGCDSGSETASPGAEAPVRTDRYEGVAATVAKLPTEAASLMLAHEDMPAFKNAAGDAVGMGPMTMPFPLDADLPADALDGFSVGDPVRFDFRVHWSPRGIPDYAITAIRPATQTATPPATQTTNQTTTP